MPNLQSYAGFDGKGGRTSQDVLYSRTEKNSFKCNTFMRVCCSAVIFAYSFGIAAALVAGVGMCLSMGVLGTELPYALGIAVGLLGFAGCGVNYPIYRRLLERGRAKYAYEIITLAREISESEAV